MNKVCTKCKESLPLSDFNLDKRSPDGRFTSCKKCVSKYRKKYNASRRGSAAKVESKKRWRARYPKKFKAQKKLQNAVAWGQIIKPDTCEMCNGKGRIEAHHADYDYPFDVEWLCHSCHVFWHQVNGEAKNASL